MTHTIRTATAAALAHEVTTRSHFALTMNCFGIRYTQEDEQRLIAFSHTLATRITRLVCGKLRTPAQHAERLATVLAATGTEPIVITPPEGGAHGNV